MRGLVFGNHANLREPISRAGTGVVVIDEEIAKPEYAATCVVIDDGHMRRARSMSGNQIAEQPIRPGGLDTAIEGALRVDVLPAMHRLAGHVVAVAFDELGNRGVVLAERRLGPIGRIDMFAYTS